MSLVREKMLSEKTSISTLNGQGFVQIMDVMGTDADIAIAARTSYGDGTKSVSDDRDLIRYLMRHRHCYLPDMEVLTQDGWKRWDECSYTETFLVPDPSTRLLSKETLPLEVFDADEDIQVYENSRMSYRVTSDHRMYFKSKYSDIFQIVRAGEMQKWGHFDPLCGYALPGFAHWSSPLGRFVGFILGDGCWAGNGVSFHLRKDRKKEYLRSILQELNISATESPSSTYADAIVFYISVADMRSSGVFEYLSVGERAKDKSLSKIPRDMPTLKGIFEGLINSDGHVREDRNGRIEFSSVSPNLLTTFETLASMCGFDAHRVGNFIHAFPPGRTTLEARKSYFSTQHYSGKVYCATTSTGLLIVRGGPDKFGFVCGNTTPFEMCEMKFLLEIPMDAWRQMIRHRTANVNEYSTRYSKAIDRCQTTGVTQWRKQSLNNKQGSSSLPIDASEAEKLTQAEFDLHCMARVVYDERLAAGVAREQARKDLPLSTFTRAVWKMDLHNLFHFLRLRMDAHAQLEIRDYANAIAAFVMEYFPVAYEAFSDYVLESVTFSKWEMLAIKFCESGNRAGAVECFEYLSKREIDELFEKVQHWDRDLTSLIRSHRPAK